jgi:hypothetical protein
MLWLSFIIIIFLSSIRSIETCYGRYKTSFIYCNVLVGSVSRWNFITLEVQYTIVNHNLQRF